MQFVCKLLLKSNHAWQIDTLWFDNIGNSPGIPINWGIHNASIGNSREFLTEFPVNWGIPNDMEKKGGERKRKGGKCGVEKGRRAWDEGRKRGGRLTWEQQYRWSHTWGRSEIPAISLYLTNRQQKYAQNGAKNPLAHFCLSFYTY